MLIVLEGMDSTGKTTLANAIIKEFPGFKYYHPVPSHGPEGMTGDSMLQDMRDLFQKIQTGENIISDRINLVSEMIYGPICRKKAMISKKQYEEILLEFMAIKPCIIYCRLPKEKVIQSLEAEEQDKKSGASNKIQMTGITQKAVALIEGYDLFFEDWRNRKILFYIYNYLTDPGYHKVFSYIALKQRLGGVA